MSVFCYFHIFFKIVVFLNPAQAFAIEYVALSLVRRMYTVIDVQEKQIATSYIYPPIFLLFLCPISKERNE